MPKPEVGIIMGSDSDLEVMVKAEDTLGELGVPYEWGIKSAHRTPDRVRSYARSAMSRELKVIIAGAGGSAALPGHAQSYTELPVIGVPIVNKAPWRESALRSIIDMPNAYPVLTVDENDAVGAAVSAARILALNNPEYLAAITELHAKKAQEVEEQEELLKRLGGHGYLKEMENRARRAAEIHEFGE
ncbi:MAG TPA: 5-(carboxyamino)imidazole ribonucleotide mutase [Candidatus Saccharimonadales bacterium]|nr:5-(carboxyamino)imidazole ribonucleotide mutase [Candidatus Saccharimonadales bacterium]